MLSEATLGEDWNRTEEDEAWSHLQWVPVLLVDDRVVGWVGARHDYGSVWELHPLVVDEAMRGRAYGRALVNDVEPSLPAMAH